MDDFGGNNESQAKLIRLIAKWYDSEIEAIDWYMNSALSAFGGLTPNEIVQIYGDAGVTELQNWIKEREKGGFQ